MSALPNCVHSHKLLKSKNGRSKVNLDLKNDPKLVLMEQDWDLQNQKKWYWQRDSDPQSLRQRFLKPSCIPIPTCQHQKKWYFGRDSNPQRFPLGCQILSLKCLSQLHHRSIKMFQISSFLIIPCGKLK